MIFLIAPESDIKNEIQILHQLFDAGLEYYHFRKPSKSIEEHRAYLDLIDPQYHERIIIHYFHELAKEYRLKGVHLQEQVRIDLKDDLSNYVNNYQQNGFSVSSSFHELEVLEKCEIQFNYHLLSPVFSSISKQGYQGRGFDVNHINKLIVGMGGINTDTIAKTRSLGYKGIGVLGGVWNTEDCLTSFVNIKNAYSLVEK